MVFVNLVGTDSLRVVTALQTRLAPIKRLWDAIRGDHSKSEMEGKAPEISGQWLEAVTDRLREFRREREWERYHTPKNLAVSVVIESGELLEHFQWVDNKELERHVASHRDEIAEELADVVIYVIQLADVLEMSLPEALDMKIRLNASNYPVSTARGSNQKYTELAASDRRAA